MPLGHGSGSPSLRRASALTTSSLSRASNYSVEAQKPALHSRSGVLKPPLACLYTQWRSLLTQPFWRAHLLAFEVWRRLSISQILSTALSPPGVSKATSSFPNWHVRLNRPFYSDNHVLCQCCPTGQPQALSAHY